MTYPEPETKPRSLVLPLFMILLVTLAFGFITTSQGDMIDELQAQIDAANVDRTLLTKNAAMACNQLNDNDIYLVKRQDAVIEEVKRLGMVQETLLIQALELEPELEEAAE